MSNFKQSLRGLNSQLSFSMISCHNKVKELSLSYLSRAGGSPIKCKPFPKVLVLYENVYSLVQDLNLRWCVTFLQWYPLHHKPLHLYIYKYSCRIYIYIYICKCQIYQYISKLSDHCQGWPEGSLFRSYYTKV